MHSFGKLVNIFGKLVHIFGKLVHIFAWKLVSRTSKQVLRNLGSVWQPGVYNDIKKMARKTSKERIVWRRREDAQKKQGILAGEKTRKY